MATRTKLRRQHTEQLAARDARIAALRRALKFDADMTESGVRVQCADALTADDKAAQLETTK